jgi:cytochrome c551/c552
MCVSCHVVDWDLGGPAHVAQLAEHILGKDEVTSSILVVGSR